MTDPKRIETREELRRLQEAEEIAAAFEECPRCDDRHRTSGAVIICGPRKDCADPHPHRWYCMRGHDGAADGVCPLAKCERQGANR
jgi:hypothetical protein